MKALTTSLIGLNILIFVISLLVTEEYWSLNNSRSMDLFYLYGTTPACISGVADCPETGLLNLLSATFMHGSVMHIFGNMLFLFAMGSVLEERLGKLKFLSIYLVAGILGNVAQTMFEPSSSIPIVGASGSVSGLMGVFLFLYPKVKIPAFFVIMYRHIKAMYYFPFWLIMWNIIPAMGISIPIISEIGGVAYMAHIGGFVVGAIVGIIVLINTRNRNNSNQQENTEQPHTSTPINSGGNVASVNRNAINRIPSSDEHEKSSRAI